jgi:anti-sigma regulatory factor (Ser/Thr protein kinase)
MLVLAVTGLVAGELVTERRRMESQLRLQQESLARVARFGSVGELAAAVAHEINQPLMAAGTYIRLVADTISSDTIDTGEVAETAKKAAAQVDRAAQVIRRLRALVRLDRSNRAPVRFERIVKGIIELCKPDLDRAGIAAHAHLAAGLPPVLVDVLQIEQVVLNLVRNSIEAISDSGGTGGSIWIEARRADDDFIEVHVLDSGPGFPRERIETGPLPLSSSKAYGLGVGLPLCTSILLNRLRGRGSSPSHFDLTSGMMIYRGKGCDQFGTRSICRTSCSAAATSAASSRPWAARRSRAASCRHPNLARYSAGKCLSNSTRTSPSVASCITSGMMIYRGKGCDQFGAGKGSTPTQGTRHTDS